LVRAPAIDVRVRKNFDRHNGVGGEREIAASRSNFRAG
jgi:hypothetical protein